MHREVKAILLFILFGENLPLHTLPIPAPPKRENNRTLRDNTGWPRKSMNFWIKDISININPIPSIENKMADLRRPFSRYRLLLKHAFLWADPFLLCKAGIAIIKPKRITDNQKTRATGWGFLPQIGKKMDGYPLPD